jgi:hypothetical protein
MTVGYMVSASTPMPPLWDTVWLGTLLVALGDVLVLAGAFIAFHVYQLQQDTLKRQRQQSSLDHLESVKAALIDWYSNFFNANYRGEAAVVRAEQDRKAIQARSYGQVYMVPTDPVASLIQPSGDLWPFSLQTLRAANIALSHMTVFNQFVRQQSEFNVLHAVEIRRVEGRHLDDISEAGLRISTDLHQSIDSGDWNRELKAAVTLNIAELWVLLAASPPNRPIRRMLRRFALAMRGDPQH